MQNVEIVMYTRKGCHLCDGAWTLLLERQRQYRFALTSIDIDADPELIALHGEKVPVVVVNGRERFFGRIGAAMLDRLLEAELRWAR